MINKIGLALINESGEFIPIKSSKLESEIEITIAETFTKINHSLNGNKDKEIRLDEKFRLCQHLIKFLEEVKNAGTSTNDSDAE